MIRACGKEAGGLEQKLAIKESAPAQRESHALIPSDKPGVHEVSAQIVDQPLHPLKNEQVEDFFADAAESGSRSSRTLRGDLPVVEAEARSELPGSCAMKSTPVATKNVPDKPRQRDGLVAAAVPRPQAELKKGPSMANNNVPDEARPRGGVVMFAVSRQPAEKQAPTKPAPMAIMNVAHGPLQRDGLATVAMPRPQTNNQGTVDLDKVCPCTLEGHDCAYAEGEHSVDKALLCSKLI